jgi:hypothetical protein
MSVEIIGEFKDGQVVLTVNGVKGKACKDITSKLEAALGTVTKDTETSEMKEKPVKTVHKITQ